MGQFDLIGEYEGQSWGTEGFRGFLDGTMDPIFSMNLDEGITSGINLSMEGTAGSTWIQNLNAKNQSGYNFIDSETGDTYFYMTPGLLDVDNDGAHTFTVNASSFAYEHLTNDEPLEFVIFASNAYAHSFDSGILSYQDGEFSYGPSQTMMRTT